MEIEVKYFKLIELTYHDMESLGIDLSEYKINIRIINNILYVHFYKQDPNWTGFGSPPGYPARQYEVDIISGEIINIRRFR